ncbi:MULTISPECIES: hypothetical protein [Streptomyces]|uniref:hypothetical protein n=1 Tax=Streptomyces TaxID=1883 RepID=UPI001E5F96A1|nr:MULTISPECIES: hypothetical protein [Streptomyces]UFQ16398.1 hypothetical protein J2N69_16095 [Streptomyces huasconensis]WCL86001.1 hypothetical protein PPN52_16100 [Streptomyces sp. JCM 35825]
MAKLPTDGVLRKLFQLGQSDQEIADQYDVTPQAVNKRLVNMGLRKKPVATRVMEQVKATWGMAPQKENRVPYDNRNFQALKYLLRKNLGDTLSEHQERVIKRLVERMEREHVVLVYDREQRDGWIFRPRQSADGDIVARYPKGVELPPADFQRANTLKIAKPESEGSTGGAADDQ